MPRSGDGGGDRRIGCEDHRPPPPSSGKRKTRSPVGGNNDDDAAVHDDNGNDDVGPGGGGGGRGEGFIACRDLTAYAGAESATTTPSLLLRRIEDHGGGLSSLSLLSFNSL
jgi:hypothetical protein